MTTADNKMENKNGKTKRFTRNTVPLKPKRKTQIYSSLIINLKYFHTVVVKLRTFRLFKCAQFEQMHENFTVFHVTPNPFLL